MDAYDRIGMLYPGHADVIGQFFVDAFVQGKFISIFSFLFGMGFAIQMSRAEAKNVRFLSFYPRRLLALAMFGVIHGALIWSGDVLLTYACSGAILLLFRNRKQKTLLWWAGGLIALPMVVSTVFLGLYFSPWRRPWMTPKPPDIAKWHAVVQVYAHGTARQILAQNWVEWKHELPTTGFAIYATSLFLLGMWTWRAGIVQRLAEYRGVLRRVCAWCLPLGLLISIFVAAEKTLTPAGTVSVSRWLARTLWLPGSHVLAAGYASGLALLFLGERWRRWLIPFAAVGRSALTNYLAQSVICTWFFYSWGTGLFGKIGPAWGWVLAVLLYAAQVGISNLWLGWFRFGPMEWLWRGMTYGELPAMRKS